MKSLKRPSNVIIAEPIAQVDQLLSSAKPMIAGSALNNIVVQTRLS